MNHRIRWHAADRRRRKVAGEEKHCAESTIVCYIAESEVQHSKLKKLRRMKRVIFFVDRYAMRYSVV